MVERGVYSMPENYGVYAAMAKLCPSDPQRLADLAAAEALLAQCKAIEAIDTSNVKPLVSVLEITNVLREDVVSQNVTREELLQNAPEQRDGCFVVPGTLE